MNQKSLDKGKIIKEMKIPEPMKCPATGKLYVPTNQMLFSNQREIVDKLNEVINSLIRNQRLIIKELKRK